MSILDKLVGYIYENSTQYDLLKDRAIIKNRLTIYHGGYDKYEKLNDNVFFSFDDYIANTYAINIGGYLYTCSCKDQLKFFDIRTDDSMRLKSSSSGYKMAGSDDSMFDFITDTMGTKSADRYRKYGLGIFSKVFNISLDSSGYPELNKLIEYLKHNGFDGILFNDESFDAQVVGECCIVFDGSKIIIDNVIKAE